MATKRKTRKAPALKPELPLEFIAFKEAILAEVSRLSSKIDTTDQNRMVLMRAEVNGLSQRMSNVSRELDIRINDRISAAFKKLKVQQADTIWNSADGPVEIQRMSDEHIVNTLRMITRRHAPKMVRAALGNIPEPFSQEYTNKLRALLIEADRRNLSWEPLEVPQGRNY